MKTVRFEKFGGPEVLVVADAKAPAPGAGQLRVRQEAIGVNFMDVYQRSGAYSVTLPFVAGQEGAGVVESLGSGVKGFKEGDRVAYCLVPGGYAEQIVLPAERAVPVPAGLDLPQAAAVMLQGMTAHYLVTSTCPLQQGDRCLIHAGAGGVGHLLIQMAKMRGAFVFTTVSTAQKAEAASRAGADVVIRYSEQDFVQEIRERTGGKGVRAVYDSVGRDTFLRGLDCLQPFGVMALFGQSSGKVEPFDPLLLMGKGSLYVTRPTLVTHNADPAVMRRRADEVLGWLRSGKLAVEIGATYPLERAADAHRDLEGRRSMGKLLLVP
jgi:NADPH2:quinone reductase